MNLNPTLEKLHTYPFEKLAKLKSEVDSNREYSAINLSIGEPQHDSPEFILQALHRSLGKLKHYPSTKGSASLRQACVSWLRRRFQLSAHALDPECHVIPVNGTREGLFAIAQAVVDRTRPAKIIIPNPFYQIYEGAALLAGAEPYFIHCSEDNHYQADFDSIPKDIWHQCQMIYLCSPGNPTGVVMSIAQMQTLIEKAHQFDFVIVADECYSEIYLDENQPPPSLLQAAKQLGDERFSRCVVFHSLSKRSNVPGLRSGFVAGDADIINKFLLYRTYHGCAMSPATQMASQQAWSDEVHVENNRREYAAKFKAVLDILGPSLQLSYPDGGFYFWPNVETNDTEFAKKLYQQYNVSVLPGSYLAREVNGFNPGRNHVRIALVAPLNECIEAAKRIQWLIETER